MTVGWDIVRERTVDDRGEGRLYDRREEIGRGGTVNDRGESGG